MQQNKHNWCKTNWWRRQKWWEEEGKGRGEGKSLPRKEMGKKWRIRMKPGSVWSINEIGWLFAVWSAVVDTPNILGDNPFFCCPSASSSTTILNFWNKYLSVLKSTILKIIKFKVEKKKNKILFVLFHFFFCLNVYNSLALKKKSKRKEKRKRMDHQKKEMMTTKKNC